MTFASTCLLRNSFHSGISKTTLSRGPILSRSIALAAVAISVAGAHAQNTFAPQPVGSRSGEQAVVVRSAAGGTVRTVEVLTAGNPKGDFAYGAGSSTCLNATLPAGGSCSELVTFAPSAPGKEMGAVVLLDGANQVLGVTLISGTGRGGLGVLVPGNVSVVAGVQGVFNGLFDGGPATDASLNLPASITMDGAGNMYIADSLHNRVRMVCGAAITATIAKTTCTTAGVISTIAGDDTPAYTGDGGPAADATLNTPNGVAVDGAGDLYIADTGNDAIRMISAAAGTITTVAGGDGTLCAGSTNAVGDGCPGAQAKLYQPWGVTLDAAGNLYIADTFNHRIREVNSATGIITTIAGTGFTKSDGSGGFNGDNILATAAKLNFPFAVAFDSSGNMYIPTPRISAYAKCWRLAASSHQPATSSPLPETVLWEATNRVSLIRNRPASPNLPGLKPWLSMPPATSTSPTRRMRASAR